MDERGEVKSFAVVVEEGGQKERERERKNERNMVDRFSWFPDHEFNSRSSFYPFSHYVSIKRVACFFPFSLERLAARIAKLDFRLKHLLFVVGYQQLWTGIVRGIMPLCGIDASIIFVIDFRYYDKYYYTSLLLCINLLKWKGIKNILVNLSIDAFFFKCIIYSCQMIK